MVTEQKKKRLRIELKSNAADSWGWDWNRKDPWKIWKIIALCPGKQGERIGLQLHDKIFAINDIIIGNNNYRLLEQTLFEGQQCAITIKRRGKNHDSTIDSVSNWLTSLGLSKYKTVFVEQEYDDMALINSFSLADIEDMLENTNISGEDAEKIRFSLKKQTEDVNNGVVTKIKQNIANRYTLLVIGCSQHGKSTTLNTIFGDECFPSGDTGQSTTKNVSIKQHPKYSHLTFVDTPGFFDSVHDNDHTYNKILESAGLMRIDLIMICRKFDDVETADYREFEKIRKRLSKHWNNPATIIVYTKSGSCLPNSGIMRNLQNEQQIYQNEPYSYDKHVSKYAVFRDLRVCQANHDGYDAVFFVENDADEKGKLPTGTCCLTPLVNFLTALFPELLKMRKAIFSRIVRNAVTFYNGITFTQYNRTYSPKPLGSGVCLACTAKNDNSESVCVVCKIPLKLRTKTRLIHGDTKTQKPTLPVGVGWMCNSKKKKKT